MDTNLYETNTKLPLSNEYFDSWPQFLTICLNHQLVTSSKPISEPNSSPNLASVISNWDSKISSPTITRLVLAVSTNLFLHPAHCCQTEQIGQTLCCVFPFPSLQHSEIRNLWHRIYGQTIILKLYFSSSFWEMFLNFFLGTIQAFIQIIRVKRKTFFPLLPKKKKSKPKFVCQP